MSVMHFEKTTVGTKSKFDVIKVLGMYILRDNGATTAVLGDTELSHTGDLVFVTDGDGTSILKISSAVDLSPKEVQRLFIKNAPKNTTFEFFSKVRFKIDGNRRFFTVNGNRIAEGAMNENFMNWRGPFIGWGWKMTLGKLFKDYLQTQFDLNWAHKAICQRRGEYQFLPNVALFFDTTADLVLKLINRPNEKDSCEGFYVGTLYGKPFGYHIDGNQVKISSIDRYVTHAVADITQTDPDNVDLVTERFATDVNYNETEDRWVLNSTIGEIGHLVKGIRPDNTCDIRKHVKWTYRVSGFSLNEIPFLEPLLVESFLRGYHRLLSHTTI